MTSFEDRLLELKDIHDEEGITSKSFTKDRRKEYQSLGLADVTFGEYLLMYKLEQTKFLIRNIYDELQKSIDNI
tara:strand:- start:4584 stop:4805 length:222 start_codon:yes stop_codon:yes gene_type:complete